MEILDFDRKTRCDWCGEKEICAVTHYGTTNYNRLICLECACSINQNDRAINGGNCYFDLNNSMIRFRDFEYDIDEAEETRHCSECDKEMHEGYCINDGCEYYCSDDCLHKHYTEEEFEQMYDKGKGDSYYTTWID